jgi:hypothetical protein
MSDKIVPNILFVLLCLGIYVIYYILEKYLSNPKITIFIFYSLLFIILFPKWYQYFIKKNKIILRKFNLFEVITAIIIIIYYCAFTQLQWIGIGFIPLGITWMFDSITFTDTGIKKSGSFLKTYYSQFASFEMTETEINYTTKSGEKYNARIFKPSMKTKSYILRKIGQQKNYPNE